MSRGTTFASLLLVALAAAACGEKPQTHGTRKSDAEPWTGGAAAYTQPGWKAGDQASWESQIHARAQTQNEYNRAPAKRP